MPAPPGRPCGAPDDCADRGRGGGSGRDKGRSPAWCRASAPWLTSSPPMIEMPSGRRSSAPSPKPRASGRAPSMAAMVVIRIGRKRSRQAWKIAACRLQPFGAFDLEGDVDHHDGVLLHDSDQQQHADHGDDAELDAEHLERQQGADARGRKRREDRDRMGCSSRTECPARCRSRSTPPTTMKTWLLSDFLEGLRRAGKRAVDGGGHADFVHGVCTKATASLKVLPSARLNEMVVATNQALVIDAKRRGAEFVTCHRRQRHHLLGRVADRGTGRGPCRGR